MPAPYPPTPRPRLVGPLPVIAMVVALLVAAAAGAGVEYALNDNTPSTGSSGLLPLGNSGAGNSGNSGSGATVPSAQVTAIAAKVDPALVDIDTTLAGGGGAAGTGMVLTSSGLVLTNNHVIENASSIVAQVDGAGRTYQGSVVGYSITDDVALVQLHGASGLRTVSTSSSNGLSLGSDVVGIGNAGGVGGTPSAVGGTITALNQTITASGDGLLPETLHGLIETDANIEPGDSGGPLVDSAGHVIGMDTAAAANGSGFGLHSGANQGYAIGIDNALGIIDQIRAGDASATVQIGPRALLGVEVIDGQSPAGALVELVEPGSPAQSAGITEGDTIVSVGGASISNAADLSDDLVSHKPGDSVSVGWVDGSGAHHSASVKLTVGPPA